MLSCHVSSDSTFQLMDNQASPDLLTAIDVVVVMCLFFAVRHFASQMWADAFLFMMYAVAAKRRFDAHLRKPGDNNGGHDEDGKQEGS